MSVTLSIIFAVFGSFSHTWMPSRLAGDRLVRPADALRRVRLHVEHVDVRRPAPLEEKDDRLRPRLDALRLLSARSRPRHVQPEQTEAADFQRVAAGDRGVEAGAGKRIHGQWRKRNSFAFSSAQATSSSARRLSLLEAMCDFARSISVAEGSRERAAR